MRKSEGFAVLLLLLLAIYVALTSVSLGLGTPARPGPGFFPFGGALIVGVSAVVFLANALRKKGETAPKADEPTRWWNVAYILGAIVVFTLLVNMIGFFACTFLMLVFFMKVVSSQPWPKTLTMALATTAGAYILFDLFLSAQLPKGPLGF
jgi:hypothetical protein